MSESKIVIPCDVLKRITPLLEKAISYEPAMFIDEFRKMEAILLIGRITEDPEKLKQGTPYYLTEEQMNFYLRKRKPEDCPLKYNPQNPYTLIYEFGNNIEFTLNSSEDQPSFSIKDFDKLWDNYHLPHDDYYYAFLVLIAVYAKYIRTYGMFEGEIYIPEEYYIRGEKLKLYEFLHRNDTSKSDTSLKISVNGVSLKLDNKNNWLKDVLYHSIGEQMDIQSVRQELSNKYTPKSKVGRRKKEGQGHLLLSAYNLIHRTSLKKDNVTLNDIEALFLIDFFKYLQLHNNKKEMDIVYMRALLSHYQEEKSLINWWCLG